MIIPLSNKKLQVGDIVVTKHDINYIWYIIKAGHEFQIIGNDKKYGGYIILDLENNIEINKITDHDITLKIDFESAKNEYYINIETKKYKEYIVANCPNRTDDYFDRVVYDECSLTNCICEPNLKCTKYLTVDQINKNVILLKYLRSDKIKYINK